MQSLRAVQRIGVRASALRRPTTLRAMSTTNISGGGLGKSWADREHAAENQYFNKRDAEILSKLASKLKNHTTPTPESIAQEKEMLVAICAKHSITPSDAFLDDLIKFKFNH